jgi:membrane fusion protein, multidrug efflux system
MGELRRAAGVSLTEEAKAARPRTRSLWMGVGVAVLLVATWAAWSVGSKKSAAADAAAKKASPAVPVGVASAERRDLPVYLSGLGSITAFNTVTVKTRVDGQIMSVAFREGQEVRQGDLLVAIDPRPYEVQLAQAQANLAKDEAQLTDARLNLDRNKELLTQGVIPRQQADSQGALVGQLEAAAQADRAQIDSARLQITYSRITAPVGGRVGLRLVDQGNVVRAADQTGLLVITQLEPITVVFTLPEDSLALVARRMKADTLPVEAWSRDDQTKLATGHLLTIDNQIDTATGTGKLKAVFDNKDRSLWPNQFVNARLLVEVRKGQTLVPSAAVQRGSTGVFAYVVKPDKTIDVRQLKVGLSQGGFTAIEDGVSPGEQVVTDGHEKVQAGTKVELRSGAGKPGGAGQAPPAAGAAS